MTATFVLHRAARALATGEIAWGREWFINPGITPGQVNRGRGCRCALGAIGYAADPSDPDGNPLFVDLSVRPIASAAAVALADYLIDELGAARCVDDDGEFNVIETVGGWNDEPRRTVHEVVAALNAAADRAASLAVPA